MPYKKIVWYVTQIVRFQSFIKFTRWHIWIHNEIIKSISREMFQEFRKSFMSIFILFSGQWTEFQKSVIQLLPKPTKKPKVFSKFRRISENLSRIKDWFESRNGSRTTADFKRFIKWNKQLCWDLGQFFIPRPGHVHKSN